MRSKHGLLGLFLSCFHFVDCSRHILPASEESNVPGYHCEGGWAWLGHRRAACMSFHVPGHLRSLCLLPHPFIVIPTCTTNPATSHLHRCQTISTMTELDTSTSSTMGDEDQHHSLRQATIDDVSSEDQTNPPHSLTAKTTSSELIMASKGVESYDSIVIRPDQG